MGRFKKPQVRGYVIADQPIRKTRCPQGVVIHRPAVVALVTALRLGHRVGMTKARRRLGEWGEKLAADHLVAGGMRVVARNWRIAAGEVDIIALDGDIVVFCEVKTRRNGTYGDAAEAVTGLKARRLRAVAAQWLAIHSAGGCDVRFDVIKVTLGRTGGPVLCHLRGVLT